MVYNAVFIQALLATVMAAPAAIYAREDDSIWLKSGEKDVQLIDDVQKVTQDLNKEDVDRAFFGNAPTDATTLLSHFGVDIIKREAGELHAENKAITAKQNFCLCPTDCIGSCCPTCDGCPEKGTCVCPCDACGFAECLCPSKFLCPCGKPNCECLPCPSCGAADCLCPSNCCPACGLPDCSCAPTPCDTCGAVECACAKNWCPKCLLPTCLCGDKTEPPCEPTPVPCE